MALSHAREAGRRSRVRVPAGLSLALTFVLVVAALVALRMQLPDDAMRDAPWIFALAVLVLLPLAIARWPGAPAAVASRVRGIKVAGVLEVDLGDVAAPSKGTDMLASVLEPLNNAAVAAPAQQIDATTLWSISAKAKELRETKTEAFIIDLEMGRRWRLPNLYFLARVLEQRTFVRQLVFVDERGQAGVEDLGHYLGTCTPHQLQGAVEAHSEQYARAGASPPPGDELAAQFQSLKQHLQGADRLHDWVSEAILLQFVGREVLRADVALEADGPLNPPDYARIVCGTARFVPILRRQRLRFIADRDRIALAIAIRAIAEADGSSPHAPADIRAPQAR